MAHLPESLAGAARGVYHSGMELMVHNVMRALGEGVPAPVAMEWVPSLLLALLWLLVAAMVAGPVVRYFGWEPRAGQGFSDDPPAGPGTPAR